MLYYISALTKVSFFFHRVGYSKYLNDWLKCTTNFKAKVYTNLIYKPQLFQLGVNLTNSGPNQQSSIFPLHHLELLKLCLTPAQELPIHHQLYTRHRQRLALIQRVLLRLSRRSHLSKLSRVIPRLAYVVHRVDTRHHLGHIPHVCRSLELLPAHSG